MIIRVWRAGVRPDQAGALERFIRERAIPHLHSQPGLVALHAGRSTGDSRVELAIVSVWRDVADVQAFVMSSGEELGAFAVDEWSTGEIRVRQYERL